MRRRSHRRRWIERVWNLDLFRFEVFRFTLKAKKPKFVFEKPNFYPEEYVFAQRTSLNFGNVVFSKKTCSRPQTTRTLRRARWRSDRASPTRGRCRSSSTTSNNWRENWSKWGTPPTRTCSQSSRRWPSPTSAVWSPWRWVLPPGRRAGQSGGRRPPGRVHSLQGGDRHLRAQYGHPGGEYYLQVGELVKVGDAAHQDVFTVFKAVTVTYERSMVTLEVSTTSR